MFIQSISRDRTAKDKEQGQAEYSSDFELNTVI